MNAEKRDPKIFDPGDPAYRWILWKRLNSSTGGFNFFFWRRIYLVSSAALLAAWLLATAGIWANAKYRHGYPDVRYIDLAAPWQWGRYRATIGAHYLDLGRAELEAGNPYSAYYNFRGALAMMPDSLECRRLVGLAQARIGMRAEALSILREGVAQAAKAGDEAYLRLYFDTAFDLQADDDARTAGQGLLPSPPDGLRIHLFLALETATALYNLSRYGEAEQLLSVWGLQDEPDAEILFARCESARGSRAYAIQRLEADLARFSQKDGILAALEGIAAERGLPQEVRRYALLRRENSPLLPAARLDLLYADRALGRASDVQSEIDSYCSDFKADAGALRGLARFAADAGQPETAQRALDAARSAGLPTADFDLALAQASLASHDYPRVFQAVALAQASGESMSPATAAALAGAKAVALLGDNAFGADSAFADFSSTSGALRPDAGLFLVGQLLQYGFPIQSRKLLERICADNPGDEPALAELVRTEATLADRSGLDANLPVLLKMRKPPRDALSAALPWLDPKDDATLRAEVVYALTKG